MSAESNVLAAILGLHAQTSLHPGAGTALGIVDLAIQRERHTRWPTIPGSALKGVLRDACREHAKSDYTDDPEGEKDRRTRRDKANREDKFLRHAFGPSTGDAHEFAGALSITDARLLAFPVRSLRGVFAWVTCPAVLDRLRRDLAFGVDTGSMTWEIPSVGRNEVVVPSPDCPCLIESEQAESKHVVLEEFVFKPIKPTGGAGAIIDWIADHTLSDRPEFEATRARFRRALLVISDDDFTHFACYATEVLARVGLDYDTKTVKSGALFYEEFLPPETILYSIVLANAARAKVANDLDARGILRGLGAILPPILQVGANETTGKGYCATRLAQGRSA